MTPEIYFELGIGARLRRFLELLTTGGDRVYEESGLNFKVSHFYAVYALSEHGPMPIAEIAKLAGFSHSAVSQLVKKLSSEGILETVRGADARQKTVSLTQTGLELVENLRPIWQAVEKTIKDVSRETNVDLIAALTALEQGFAKTSFYDRVKATLAAKQAKPVTFSIEIYDVRYKQAFYDYNVEWIASLFVVEPIDERDLSDPEGTILAKGGEVFFAVEDERAIGAVALKSAGGGNFELTKLAVDTRARGSGAGRALCEKVIERFEARGGNKLFLYTNSKLENAIRLYWKLGFKELPLPEGTIYKRSDYYMEWQGPEPIEQPALRATR
ncbi:MAG: hypothetical protein COB37_08830 [Kordiimonadales bacterium]|nr:MAG: hypothetical protein COB37_08830 [Kordiimonadales bacterium]